jgi:hypothetical protein
MENSRGRGETLEKLMMRITRKTNVIRDKIFDYNMKTL